MRNFIKYWNETNPDDQFPTNNEIPGSWFAERGLPMIVACACCTSTMALPSAFVSDDEYVYCENCAGVE